MQWISTFTNRIKHLCQSAWTPLKRLIQLSAAHQLDKEKEEELKRLFLSSDFGVSFTGELLTHLKNMMRSSQHPFDEKALTQWLEDYLTHQLNATPSELLPLEDDRPKVILFVGVNGGGKTTSLAKLGHLLQRSGKSIALGAGDTFRAAAIDQLRQWSEKLHCPIIAQPCGSDPAAALFDAWNGAKKFKSSFLLADTAGRLTQPSLAKELQKIVHVLKKQDASAPHEIFCVIDATLGQNSLKQVEWFHQAIGLSGIIVTKLDGTAKGGIIFEMYKQFKIPIRYIGFGEGIDDLQPFNPELFVKSLLENL